MSTTTEKLGLIKPEKTDPADITAMNQNWDKIDARFGVYEATSVDGIDYTANVDSVSELYEGLTLTFIANMNNTNWGYGKFSPTLNVSGLGKYEIKRDWLNTALPIVVLPDDTINPLVPFTVQFKRATSGFEIDYYWSLVNSPIIDLEKDTAGTLSIKYGGTGAVNIEDARKNLGAAPLGYVEDYIKVNTADDFNAKIAELENTMAVRTTRYYVLSKELHEDSFPQCDYFIEINKSYHGFSVVTAKGNHNGNEVNLHRVLFNNTWGEWEWENPILYWGVEYRTTEKWNGAPVYTKWISHTPSSDIGNLNGTYGFPIEFSTPNFKQLLRYSGSVAIENGSAFPSFDSDDGYIGMNFMNSGGIAVAMKNKLIKAGTTLDIQVWYTKW